METASKRHKGRAAGGALKKSFRGMTAKRYEATMEWDHLSFYTKNDFNHWKKKCNQHVNYVRTKETYYPYGAYDDSSSYYFLNVHT